MKMTLEMDCGSFPLFPPPCNWKASEEVTLLELVELYSYGNWGDISVFIPNKTTEEIKQHFTDYYINGNIGQATWDLVKSRKNVIEDHSSNEGPLSPSLTTPLTPIPELSLEQSQQLGYMPKRDDFEREYDNEVESLVATLSMNIKDEDDLDRDIKLAYIDIYNRRLAERFRRKDIVRKYGLVDLFYKNNFSKNNSDHSENENREGKVSTRHQDSSQASFISTKNNLQKRKLISSSSQKLKKEEREIDDNLKIYSQYLSKEEFDELYKNLIKEKELKMRIKELIRYRRNGLTKISEIGPYEIARSCRDKKKENKKKLQGSGENIGSDHKLTKSSTPERDAIEAKSSNQNQKIPVQGQVELTSKGSKVFNLGLSDQKEKSEEQSANTVDMTFGHRLNVNRLTSGDSLEKSKSKFEVSSMPGARLLSIRERKLCISLKLRPTQYITLKTLILKEHIDKMYKKCTSKSTLHINKNVRQKVSNFIVKNGWVCAS